MKKLYTLLVIMIAASLSAAALQTTQAVKGRHSIAASRAAASVTHDWHAIGTGTFTDDLLPAVFKSLTASTYQVAVEADEANPGYYRITDPYTTHPSYSLIESAGYISQGTHYITIDATDPDNVIIEPSQFGVNLDGSQLMVYSYSWMAANGDPDITEAYVNRYNLRGKLTDGIITFATPGSLWVTTPELDPTAQGWTADLSGAFKLMLPGVKDYSVEVATEGWCTAADHTLIVSAWTGADVASVRIAAVADPDNTQAVDAALAAAPAVDPRQGTILEMPAGTGSRAKVYIVAASYDTAGKEQARAWGHCYTPDTSTAWTPMAAKARFTDDIVSSLFTDIDLGTYDADIEQSTVTPGRYRLVNPYLGVTYNTIDGYHGAHSHYIYIDATDPDCVIIEESPVGMGTIDYGHIAVTSQSWRMICDGKTTADIKAEGFGGVMRDGVITFPNAMELVAAFHTESGARWYHVNYTSDANGNIHPGRLAIDISAAGIADITADDTPAVYYNLQGIRIAEPAEGSIVIESRGGNTRTVKF